MKNIDWARLAKALLLFIISVLALVGLTFLHEYRNIVGYTGLTLLFLFTAMGIVYYIYDVLGDKQ